MTDYMEGKLKVIYIVGKILEYYADGSKWTFFGAFSSREKAERECKDENYFVGPVEIDTILPDDPVMWPNAYYPELESMKMI